MGTGMNKQDIREVNGSSNLANNLEAICSLPGVAVLKGKFKNVPAVIAVAGPSLDKNLTMLAQNCGSVLVFSVDSALKALERSGVKVDLVFSLETSEQSLGNFEGLEVFPPLVAGTAKKEPMRETLMLKVGAQGIPYLVRYSQSL